MYACPSVCPSAWDSSAPTARIFMGFEFFSKICTENISLIKICQDDDQNIFLIISRPILFSMRNISEKPVAKTKNHISSSKAPPPKKRNRGVYEIMYENMVALDRPQMTIWRMRTARRMTKATNTHSGYVIFIAFQMQKWLHERASMLRYTYIACLVGYNV